MSKSKTFHNNKGDGISILILCIVIIIYLVYSGFRLISNYYLQNVRTELTDALDNATDSAVHQIDLSSYKGLIGLSNGGDYSNYDIATKTHKVIRLDELKALQTFSLIYAGNIKKYIDYDTYPKTASAYAYSTIDRILIFYPNYGTMEAYIFTPSKTYDELPDDFNPVRDIGKGFIGLPNWDSPNTVQKYSDYFNVVPFADNSNKEFTDQNSLQTALNEKAGTSGYGDTKVFFTLSRLNQFGTSLKDTMEDERALREYSMFTSGSSDVLYRPFSALTGNDTQPVIVVSVKNFIPKQIYLKDEDFEGYSELSTSHIVIKSQYEK